jgi:4-alpha-glucanotransferase
MNAHSDWLSRSAGILLHPTSLPGPYGVGDLGPTAHAWVDTLALAGQSWWQVLPLGPTGKGDSPYSSFSAFAGNPVLVSPELLLRDGLAVKADLDAAKFPAERVDFGHVPQFKYWLLDRAFEAYQRGAAPALRVAFAEFCLNQAAWLDDFALYMALKEKHGGGDWREWPTPLARRDDRALAAARAELGSTIDRHRFRQFIFFRQLAELRAHATAKHVRLLGDAPIFVAADSTDAWANPEIFLLGPDHKPSVVAGVPPDYFSETGQLWGNPLYDWDAMKKTGYRWWVRRLKALFQQFDVVRLDHFRGFEAAWHVPADAKDAVKGEWVPGPGIDLFNVLRKELGGLPLVAEDLGLITDEVDALREAVALPGMRVLQFAFGGDPTFRFLPHHFEKHTVVYTGTHDNDTTEGWFLTLPAGDREYLLKYAPGVEADPAGELMRMAWASVADLAIVPLQDVLGLGTDARMNVPGLADGNWGWRVTEKQLNRKAFERLGDWTWRYDRKAKAPQVPSPDADTMKKPLKPT